MLKRLKHWRTLFYAGPRFLGVTPWRGERYQSPTITAMYWGYALVACHFTLPGRIIFTCSGLVFLYAMFSLDMPIHLLAFAVLALLAVNVALGFALRPRLLVRRQLPSHIAAGGEQTVTYQVTNLASRTIWDLALDTLPFPREIALARGRAFLPALGPGEGTRVTAQLRAMRRGRYLLPAVRADSAFPFNLWRWGCHGDGPQSLTVYPAFTPLQRLELQTRRRYQPGGIALSSNVGDSMEFLGCRTYRDGDDPRHLHWRSWARTSYPIVKEFREEYFCRTALILDTWRPTSPWLHGCRPLLERCGFRRDDAVFEAAVSLAAAVADFLAARDYVVDLFAAGTRMYQFRGGRGLGALENILDVLACVDSSPHEPFTDISAALTQELAQISSAVFLFLVWNEARRRLLDEIRSAGVTIKAVLITGTNLTPPDRSADLIPVPATDIREGRLTRL